MLIVSLFLGFNVNAGLIEVSYNGSFDESTIVAEDGLPAGDYDTIGGLEDVALFNLIEGENHFFGSIFSPADVADVFTVGVSAGLSIVGARIDWGTNLPGISFTPFVDLVVPSGYLQQNTWGNNAPTWYFEESSPTPEIFTISGLEDGVLGETSKTFYAPQLDVTEGIYSSLLSASGTCAQTYSYTSQGFLQADCVDGIDYKMTFLVESNASTQPPADVPEPKTILLYCVALLAMTVRRYKSTK